MSNFGNSDIRWIQRLDNYQRALKKLLEAVAITEKRPFTDLEKQGLIQAFEFTHELAWNVMKDFLTEQGISDIIGSKGATRAAFKNNLLSDGEIWMDMILSRNKTSHTYNDKVAQEIVDKITSKYAHQFSLFEKVMKEKN